MVGAVSSGGKVRQRSGSVVTPQALNGGSGQCGSPAVDARLGVATTTNASHPAVTVCIACKQEFSKPEWPGENGGGGGI